MIVSLIAAVDENFGIGLDNKLPWGRIKEDMDFFKTTTLNSTVIMGRKTFESIGSTPLISRKNIVITSRKLLLESDSLLFMSSIEEAITNELLQCSREIFIIGGSQIYNSSIKYADRLYITHIPDCFDCDTFFPKIDENIYNKKKIKTIRYNDKNADIYIYNSYKIS